MRAAASSSALSTGTSRPAFPSSNTRRNASRSLATTAVPAAIASTSTMPKLSPPVFGAQYTSALRIADSLLRVVDLAEETQVPGQSGRPPPAALLRRRGRRSGSRYRGIARPAPEAPPPAPPCPFAIRRTGRGTAPTCLDAGIRRGGARWQTIPRRRRWEFGRRPIQAPPSASAWPDRTPRCGRRSSREMAEGCPERR